MERLVEESHHLFEELMHWWLWSDKKAVLSHATAAALYGLGGLFPEKIHLSVPPNFHKRTTKGLILYKVELRESEITMRDGLPVTKPLRTILDLAASRQDEERLEAIVRDAIVKGLTTSSEVLAALAAVPRGIDLAIQTRLQLAARRVNEGPYAGRSTVDEIPQVREEPVAPPQSVEIRKLLADLKKGLQFVYGDRLSGVYLFGSYARGEADRESDLDVLVVIDTFDRYVLEVRRTGALAADLSLKYGVTVSLVFLRKHEWFEGDTPFLSNVRDEAIPA